MNAARALRLSLSLLFALGAAEARADELKLDWNGKIQADLRYRVEKKSVGDFYDKLELPVGVERNQNLLNLKLKSTYGSFAGVASIDLVLDGYTGKLQGISALSEYNQVQPYRFEPQALYLEGKDLVVKGLDLRVGQQIVSWGVGDQFNPTNNLNADDLRDPLLFGKQQANFMVKLDYWVTKSLSLTGVLVPIFKPALLPRSAALGVASIDRVPFTSEALRHRVEAESAASGVLGHPTVVANITPSLPEPAVNNMQIAYRIAGTLGEQDVALSYYNGRTDFPQPILNHARQSPGEHRDPADPTRVYQDLLETDVTLAYPRMHVYGLNIAGEFNPFKWISESIHGIGYRVEGALIVPEQTTMKIENDQLNFIGAPPKGEYDYNGRKEPGLGPRPNVVDPTPFLKWVVGLDYSFGEHVYANLQWVHGLVDEFGAGDFIHPGYVVRKSSVQTDENGKVDEQSTLACALGQDGTKCANETLRPRLGDYVILGVDLKFLDDAALFRLFTIWDASGIVDDAWDPVANKRVQKRYSLFTPEGFAAVIFPEFDYNFGNGLELSLGALIQLGPEYSKFGDPAAGGSTVWTRGRYSF
jgi:hypothetical protein